MKWYLEALRKYSVIDGRARRMEYWMFNLMNFLIMILIAGIEAAIGSPSILGIAYALAMVIPSLAVTVRRLHDTNRSGWWILIPLVPVIGGIILFVFTLLDSDPQGNEYGPNPKLA